MSSANTTQIGFALGGCLETAALPYHLLQFQATRPEVSTAFAVSPHGLDFVTKTTLQAVSKRPVYTEGLRFDPLTSKPFHIAFSEFDLLVIYPATARIIAEAALGIISCPVTRSFSFMSKKKVIITPYLHPKMELAVYEDYISRLQQLGCMVVLPDEGLVWLTQGAWTATKQILCRTLGSAPGLMPPACVQAFGPNGTGK